MKRIQSLTLFITIGLLLTLKSGLSLWHTPTDDVHQITSAQTASAQTASVQAASVATTIPHALVAQSDIIATQQQTIPPVSSNESWAMLKNYLIPEANAESSPPRDSTQVIEDKTLTSLRQFKTQLEQRAKKLDTREQSLQEAEDKLKQRITELEQLEASIQQRLADEAKVKNKKIKRLTAVYEGMKPERAAPVIAKMDLKIVVKIFLLMDEKKVGKILSFLPPDQAVSISQALTRQISTVQ